MGEEVKVDVEVRLGVAVVLGLPEAVLDFVLEEVVVRVGVLVKVRVLVIVWEAV